MEITVHAKRVEPLHFTCFFVENFSGFHLQDKHNASNLPKCRDESFGSSLQMYNLIPKYLQCFRKILQVCNKFIVCVEFLQSMCRRTEMDTCNFCNEDLCFFLEASSDNFAKQLCRIDVTTAPRHPDVAQPNAYEKNNKCITSFMGRQGTEQSLLLGYG